MGDNNFNKLNRILLTGALGLGLTACNESSSSTSNQGDPAELKALTASFEASTRTLSTKSQESEQRIQALEGDAKIFASTQCSLKKVAKGSSVKMSVGQEVGFVDASRSSIVEKLKLLSIETVVPDDCEPGQNCIVRDIFNFEIQNINLTDCSTFGAPRMAAIEWGLDEQTNIYLINTYSRDLQTIIVTLLESAI